MKKLLLTMMMLLITASGAQGLVILDFEGIAHDYWYFDGGRNISDYYADVTFGKNATILENYEYGYHGQKFITHSGNSVLYSGREIGIQADFNLMVNHVHFYYSSFDRMNLYAYDENWNLVQRAGGRIGVDMNGYLEVNSNEFNIAHIRIASPDYGEFIIDDFGYEPLTDEPTNDPVPEPSTLILLASGVLGIAGISRLRRK